MKEIAEKLAEAIERAEKCHSTEILLIVNVDEAKFLLEAFKELEKQVLRRKNLVSTNKKHYAKIAGERGD